MVAEAGDGALGGGFVEFDADSEEADDSAGSDEAGERHSCDQQDDVGQQAADEADHQLFQRCRPY